MTLMFVILLPFLAAACIPIFYRRLKKSVIHLGWFVLAVPVILFVLLTTYIPQITKGQMVANTFEWIPTFHIDFTTYLDGLSMIFALLITGVGGLVVLYSIFYLSKKESLHHFYCYLLLFMGAMLGVVLSDNLIVLYAFWELTSVSSFLLIAYWHQRKASRAGARKAMTITVAGGVAMLAGFLMLYAITGTFSIQEILSQLDVVQTHPLFVPVMILVLLGAFTKSAQFPFHIWLPDAMEAPTPVSAYLHSATMVKAGIYLVARTTPIFGGHEVWFWVVSLTGLITLFWGSLNAVKQYDLKAILAFSTVSQLGLIMCLFGLGSAALYNGYTEESVIYTGATFAALFHLINHSTFKGALFMMVGIVDHEVGTRDIRRLGGLMAMMPLTFTVAVIGSASMAGLPPFNGFLSKEMFFTAAVQITELNIFSIETFGLIFPIVAWLASIFTFVYSVLLVSRTFLGKVKPERLEKPPHEAPLGMLISPFILILLVVGIFLFPNVLGSNLLQPAMASIYPTFGDPSALTLKISAWHGFNLELFMTVGVIVLGIVLYKTLPKWRSFYRVIPERFTLNAYYNAAIDNGELWSDRITKRYMSGNLTHYFIYIYIIFVVITSGYFLLSNAFSWVPSKDSAIVQYELVLVLTMIFAAFAILFTTARIPVVLLNGVLGYGVAFFFVIFRAPDLALTQLVVESITTALFLICFRFLPDSKPEKQSRKVRFGKATIAIAVGATVTVIGLAVLNYDAFTNISSYFENAYELAGGKNIVNTILGDFRAFDTMLEVVVLFIAGLGVYALIKLKAKKEGEDVEN